MLKVSWVRTGWFGGSGRGRRDRSWRCPSFSGWCEYGCTRWLRYRLRRPEGMVRGRSRVGRRRPPEQQVPFGVSLRRPVDRPQGVKRHSCGSVTGGGVQLAADAAASEVPSVTGLRLAVVGQTWTSQRAESRPPRDWSMGRAPTPAGPHHFPVDADPEYPERCCRSLRLASREAVPRTCPLPPSTTAPAFPSGLSLVTCAGPGARTELPGAGRVRLWARCSPVRPGWRRPP